MDYRLGGSDTWEAMINFTNTILISRPVSEVYAYLAGLEHTPEWN